jgi:hypothetical protein
VIEKIHGMGEFGALFLKLADLILIFLVKLDIAEDQVWDLGDSIFVHIDILGKTTNSLLELSVASPLFGKEFHRFLGFDTGAGINVILSGAIVLEGSLRSDLRVIVLIKVLVDNAFQASKPTIKEEVFFILGIE